MAYTMGAMLSASVTACLLVASSGCSGTTSNGPSLPANQGGSASSGAATAGAPAAGGVPATDMSPEPEIPPDGPEPNTSPASLNAHDLSVLFPLTGASSRDELWAATLAGAGGELLPLAVFERIARPVFQQVETPDVEHATLRVVGLRIDPCFGSECRRQVRLVWQAIEETGNTRDGAVHALYDLDDAQFRSLISELRQLKSSAPENEPPAPLGVSRALLAQGLLGPYGTGLRASVTKLVGSASLRRVTFMTRTNARQGQWEFGGFDVGVAQHLAIPALPPETELQTFSVGLDSPYQYRVTPLQLSQSALVEVLTGSDAAQASDGERQAALEALGRLQNPELESADTADCASCHFAGRLRRHLEQAYGAEPAPASDYSWTAELQRVTNEADENDSNLRAFGYFGTWPVVSRRTANETVAAQRYVAQTFP